MHATNRQPDPRPNARFNVLLTEDREHTAGHWTRQLPRLLEPQGVKAYVARTGREAVEMVNDLEIHAALIDLATPQDDVANQPAGTGSSPVGEAQGLWVLEVLKRQPTRPPIVMVNSLAIARIQAQRFLNDALRLGAFSVVNRPSDLEDMLAVIRRLIDRQYEGTWPNN
jgi:DNA-binding response OmpR family regulator